MVSVKLNRNFIRILMHHRAVIAAQMLSSICIRAALKRKWLLLVSAIIGTVVWAAVPLDWAPLDLMTTMLDHRDSNFEGPTGRPWKRILDRCPANTTCIHLATHRFGSTSNWESVLARDAHPSCSNDCQLVSDPSQAHGLMFHIFDLPSRRRLRRMHFTRRPGQAWIMYNIEPPIHVSTSKCYYTCNYIFPIPFFVSYLKELFLPSYLLRKYPETTIEASFFNFTMTYRRDSTFYTPYAEFGRIPDGEVRQRPLPPPALLVSRKKYLMFAAVSNCHPYNRREEILRELESVMELHVFGRCGSRRMAPGQDTITVSEQYYFYLSIENSFCKDYITEKFFISGLNGHSVPVVFGGTSKEEYEAIAPPMSYIYAGDFPSAAALARHLRRLASSPTEYAQYKKWQATHTLVHRGASKETNVFCSICKKLRSHVGQETKLDLNQFYNTGVECEAPNYWPFRSKE